MQIADKEICFLLRQGSRRGMDLLFEKYFESLVLWSVTFVDDLDLSKDIVQDLFFDIWRKKQYKEWKPETLSAYLYVSARNRCYNTMKKKDVLRNVLSLSDIEVLYDDYQDNKEQILMSVMKEIEQLPEKGKEVVKCVYMKGMSYKETATVLDVSVATVKTHLVRSLKALRINYKNLDNFLFFIFSQKK